MDCATQDCGFHFIGCGDGSSDNLFGIYLETWKGRVSSQFQFSFLSDQVLLDCFCTPNAFHTTIR